MSHRNINLFSLNQSKFTNADRSDLGGWTVTSSDTVARRLEGRGFYATYNPNYPEYGLKNTLALVSTGSTASMEIKSPWMTAEVGKLYMFSLMILAQFGSFDVVVEGEGNNAPSDSGATVIKSQTEISLSEGLGSRFAVDLSNGARSGDASYGFIRTVVRVTNSAGGNIPAERLLWLFDPVLAEYGTGDSGSVTNLVYNDLPSFMRLDDKNINDLAATSQPQFPLFRFTETLCYVLDHIDDEAVAYTYTRPTEGTERKSKLVDPLTTSAAALPWLSSVTGSTLLTAASGFTPWLGLEEYDGPDAGSDPGQWDDLESASDWSALQALDPDFFDSVQGYRDQISTGATGRNAGRPDSLVEYVRTILDSNSPDTEVVVFISGDYENPFRSKLLVDPAVDPDDSGSLIVDAIASSVSAGSTVRKVASVYDSGKGSFDMSKVLYPATHSDSGAKGLAEMDTSFVDDKDGFARHLLMNEDESADVPEVAGGIGSAHYTSGGQYFYGQRDGSPFSSGFVLTDATSSVDLGGLSSGLDVLVELSDVTFPEAALDTAGDGGNTPADWLFREKRLIVSGAYNGSSGNDWALYMVSGLTPGADSDTRLLFIDGYLTQNSSNYAYSEPLPKQSLTKQGDFFVRVSVTSGGEVTFYAQPDDHDDWAGSALGTSTLTGVSGSAGSSAQIQVLGHNRMVTSSDWAYAPALSCAVKQVKIFDSPLTFTNSGLTSSSAHAYIDGDATTTYEFFGYEDPLLEIDFTGLSPYTTTFNSTLTVSGSSSNLNTTVYPSPPADNDYRVMAIKGEVDGNGDPTLWYFGSAPASYGDTLTAALTASTSYDVKPYAVTTSDGTVTSAVHTIAADGSGDLTLDTTIESNYYSDKTLTKIEVYDSTDGSASGTRVAYYLPTTIAASAVSGVDDDTVTWTLSRNFPASSVAYVPAQSLSKDAIHMYEGSPYINNSPTIEVYDKFSVALQVRRFWNDTGLTMDIFRLENSDGYGLHVYYDGDSIKADFTDGTNTESVSYTESPAFGDWHVVVVRRNPESGFVLNVDGTDIETATISATTTLTNQINVASIGQGDANTFASRFALAHYAFFDRYLTDNEITLLNSEIS